MAFKNRQYQFNIDGDLLYGIASHTRFDNTMQSKNASSSHLTNQWNFGKAYVIQTYRRVYVSIFSIIWGPPLSYLHGEETHIIGRNLYQYE